MLAKILAWSSLGMAVLFAGFTVAGVFGWESLGPTTARSLFWYGAVPTFGLSALLATAILVLPPGQAKG